MAQTRRKPTEQAPRTKTTKLPASVALEKQIEALRDELVTLSATAGLARTGFVDVKRYFGDHPSLKNYLPDLADLDKLTSGTAKYAATCVELVKALHKAARKAIPAPLR